MTGKEAIEKIQRYREYMCRQCLTPLMIGKCRDKCIAKALDMAIDSLVMADMKTQFEEPEINPCRGCEDYDGKGGCKTKGGCADRRGDLGD